MTYTEEELKFYNTKDYYYNKSHKELRWTQGSNQLIVETINRGGSVLEFGCGTASIVGYLLPGIKYTGVDISEFALQRAKENYPQGEFINSLPQDRQFDSIMAYASIEHIRSPKETIDNFIKILKPNSHLILVGPNHDLFWSIPNAIRHYSRRDKYLFRLKRLGDYVKRVFGILTWRVVPQNFTEARGIYRKPDDDLRYVLSSHEVITYLKRQGLKINFVESFPPLKNKKDIIRKLLTFLPGMKYYGRELVVIARK